MSSRSPDDLVSIVMPVHNALPHLDAAVQSILGQSHRGFEFIIYDDGSTDGSTERLRDWAGRDSRIKLFEGEHNLGPALSSNWVVDKATAPIVARMDADDISHPDRIARELELLRARPEVGLVGTLCEIIDANGRKLRDPELWRVARKSLFAPFPHGSIMFRRALFDRVGGYRRQCEYWEDQDLVFRMAAQTSILVIPLPLYRHRQSTVSTRIASDQGRVERAVDRMYRSMDRLGEHRSYDDLLHGVEPVARKLDPRVFISLGSLVLWSGGKPKLLGRLLRRGRLGLNFRTAAAIGWSAWAAVNPDSLRLFLRLIVRMRNLSSAVAVASADPVRWQLPDGYTAAGGVAVGAIQPNA